MEILERHSQLYRSLERNKVEYLIIGGVACGIYGSPRATKDIDLFIKPTLENAQRLLKALKEAGFGTAHLTSAKKIIANEINIFEDWVRLDILTKVKGIKFERAWERREEYFFRRIKIRIVSIDDLISSKIATKRVIDKEDIKILRKIKKMR